MSELPVPPVPLTLDLGKLNGFMLDTVRLLGSELVALSTGEEFKAAVLLWCRAWHQRPACSLPDDDRVLASFAMTTPARWQKIKSMALRGFVKCADGRLYHLVLAADGLRAGEAILKRHERTKAATEARANKRNGIATTQRDEQREEPSDDQRHVAGNAVPGTGQGQRQEEEKEPPIGGFKKRATRLPSDWKPSATDREFARSLGLDADAIGPNFYDYWIAKAGAGATKVDWSATWRTWCRREAKLINNNTPRPNRFVRPPPSLLETIAARPTPDAAWRQRLREWIDLDRWPPDCGPDPNDFHFEQITSCPRDLLVEFKTRLEAKRLAIPAFPQRPKGEAA